MQESNIFYSNRIEALFECLKQRLFSQGGGPFASRLVVVSSQAMRDWLAFRLASSEHLGILMGVSVCLLPSAIKQLSACDFPSSGLLALRLEAEIRQLLDGNGVSKYPGLVKALGLSLGEQAQKRRLSELSVHLGKLFTLYGLYGADARRQWLEQSQDDWQALLWKRIFEGNGAWAFPQEALAEPQGVKESQVHLFAPTFVPRVYQEFLDHVGESSYCATYVLSPCQVFWTDTLSDREGRRLGQFWRQRGAEQRQLEELDHFLRDRNPLLANFGRLGREYHTLLEARDRSPWECYELAAAVAQCPQYQEVLYEDIAFDGSTGPLSLLQAVQADMLLLRQPRQQDRIAFSVEDSSIQVHLAPNRWREVEILHDNLMRLVEQGVPPHEILVMAPDIMRYQPYVEAIFDSKRSPLPYQILDIRVDQESGYFQAFIALLDLAEGRWDRQAVIELLENPYIQARLQLDADECRLLCRLIRQMGVRWGFSAEHRNLVLQRDGCDHGMQEETNKATWEQAFRRLIRGLVSDQTFSGDVLPAPGLEGSQGELVGRWIQWMRDLYADLGPLTGDVRLSPAQWSHYLSSLLDAYLQVPSDDSLGARDIELLRKQLCTLEEGNSSLSGATYPFASIRRQLEELWAGESKTVHEHIFHSVRFCSLLPMRSIPAKAICLLGMDEDSFPRREEARSLNRLFDHSGADYCPSRTDYDRYLFLESLLSARDCVRISYVAYDGKDASEVGASLVVSELLSYLDESYQVGDRVFSDHCIFRHPFEAFAPHYFDPHGKLNSYHQMAYRAACTLQHPSSKRPSFGVRIEESEEVHALDIRFLQEVAKNPLKTYLGRSLGIYPRSLDRDPVDEPFTLDALERYQLRSESLDLKVEDLLQLADRRSQLPFGLFRDVAGEQLRQEVEELKENLSAHHCLPETYFRLDFVANVDEARELNEKHWLVPAVKLCTPAGKQVSLTGSILEASPSGLPLFHRGGFSGAIRAWPSFLMYWLAVKQGGLTWQERLVFGREGQEYSAWEGSPQSLLGAFVDHALDSVQVLTPLLPEWTEVLMKEEVSIALSQMEGMLEGKAFSALYNEQATWLFQRRSSLEELAWGQWKERALDLWTPMARAWFPKIAEKCDASLV